MRKYRDWDSDYYDEYRDFKKPKKIEKDKSHKYKKSVHEMVDEVFDEDYFDDVLYDEFDEQQFVMVVKYTYHTSFYTLYTPLHKEIHNVVQQSFRFT